MYCGVAFWGSSLRFRPPHVPQFIFTWGAQAHYVLGGNALGRSYLPYKREKSEASCEQCSCTCGHVLLLACDRLDVRAHACLSTSFGSVALTFGSYTRCQVGMWRINGCIYVRVTHHRFVVTTYACVLTDKPRFSHPPSTEALVP